MKKLTWQRDILRLLGGALLFAPLLVLVAAVNAKVDPANLFHKDYELQAAQIVASGQNASQLRNMDDREFQRQCAQLRPAPDTLVLGSSRSLQLTAEGMNCPGLFNAGVTNGDLRDMISFYRLYKQLGKQPRRAILMADYCTLSTAKLDGRAYTQGYAAFAAETETEELKTSVNNEKWRQLFAPTYFQTSIYFLESGGRSEYPVPTDAYETDSDMRRADGSYSYGPTLRDMTAEQRIRAGESTALHIAHNMGAYEETSPVLQRQFELFVQQLQADGVEVLFLLPPINPHMYAAMQADENYRSQLQLEEYYRALAQQYGISCIGSYDAAALGLTELDFYDALHCSLESTNLYLAAWQAAA